MENNRLNKLLAMYDEKNHDSFVLFAVAVEYGYTGDKTNAIVTFEKLRSIDPEYVGLYYHLAHLYEEQGQKDQALLIYDEGINKAKKQADFHALSELANA